jgi:hypothetical protein
MRVRRSVCGREREEIVEQTERDEMSCEGDEVRDEPVGYSDYGSKEICGEAEGRYPGLDIG